jgi:hypothetical protein
MINSLFIFRSSSSAAAMQAVKLHWLRRAWAQNPVADNQQ